MITEITRTVTETSPLDNPVLWILIVAGILFVLIVGLVIYFLPSLIAYRRRHRNRLPIFVLNLLFGTTGLAWAIALIWSLTDNVERP